MAKKIDWGLKFYREVFRLDALHFGLWGESDASFYTQPPQELSLENMRLAQKRYTENLISLMPSEVKSVLDVGCGSGSVSRVLKDKGFEVTAITPDEYQAEIFKEKNPDIDFRQVSFEEFKSDKPYDLVLFAESFQYMNLSSVLKKCVNAILSPDKGYILISDYFRKTPQKDYYKTCHTEEDFLKEISRLNLSILEAIDITERVAPTLDLGAKIYKEYALPILEIISGYASEKIPLITRIASFVFSHHLKKIRSYLYERMSDKLDSSKFRRLISYKVYLLKKI